MPTVDKKGERRASMKRLLIALTLGVACSSANAGELFRALVFTKTAGFRHSSIPNGVAMINALSIENCFVVEHTEDASQFNETNLARFDVVIFLCTTGDILDAQQQAAFESYINDGGAYVGIHSASDTEYSWPFYGELIGGGYFLSHPSPQTATIRIEDAEHPSTQLLPSEWERFDEWYNFQNNPRPFVRVLATLDEMTYTGGSMGADHPIMWCREFAGGRSWYTAGGHTEASYSEPLFRAHVLGGIYWAAGYELGQVFGDANGDRMVNGSDLSVLLAQFGITVTPGNGADFNEDGIIDGADLSILLANFGTTC